MIKFVLLSSRPRNNVVYYANQILKGLDPFEGGYKTHNPFTWIKEALSFSGKEVIAMFGVDTTIYFVFLNTSLCVFFFFLSPLDILF